MLALNKIFLAFLFLISIKSFSQQNFDVVIIGGGASGTMAAIQAAREGVSVCLIEEGSWLGGMLTSAGVSAIDGNHKIPGGLWQEFRKQLYDHYGGTDKLATGWVSNTLFEPHVGDSILKTMVAHERNITTHFSIKLNLPLFMKNKRWQLSFIDKHYRNKNLSAKIIIDATELADVYASLSKSYDVGMEASSMYNELFAPATANDIIQDLTYVAILKDYGPNVDKTIAKPASYKKENFSCACETADPSLKNASRKDCSKMMAYGKLPNDKYMINWPNCGNDFYTNIIELNNEERILEINKAKEHTLCFLYYLQSELGYKNLGLADHEFPTVDLMPMIPYHRESRRIRGKARLLVNYLIDPFNQEKAYYKTGIAVGDYPVDHHHKKNTLAPSIDFINIKIGSYNIPIGSLIPVDLDNFIVAEKSISVSNIVNGTTRLQPAVMGIGQAAGALAAEAVLSKQGSKKINIRNVQQRLLSSKAYIMPYIDVPNTDPDFQTIQRIGATGIMKGTPIPYNWANQTWFYPDSLMTQAELIKGLRSFNKKLFRKFITTNDHLTLQSCIDIMNSIKCKVTLKLAAQYLNLANFDSKLSRRATSKLLDKFYKPFDISINFDGR